MGQEKAMQTDRTTKLLLFLIAAALWGLLLKPLLGPLPATAAARRSASANGNTVSVDIKSIGGKPVGLWNNGELYTRTDTGPEVVVIRTVTARAPAHP
jgi:hypothetical protein